MNEYILYNNNERVHMNEYYIYNNFLVNKSFFKNLTVWQSYSKFYNCLSWISVIQCWIPLYNIAFNINKYRTHKFEINSTSNFCFNMFVVITKSTPIMIIIIITSS